MADAQVSKTCGVNTPCGFDSLPRHQVIMGKEKSIVPDTNWRNILANDVILSAQRFDSVLDSNSSFEKLEAQSRNVISLVRLSQVYLPPERHDFIEDKVRTSALVLLRRSVVRYHNDRFAKKPDRILRFRRRDQSLMMRHVTKLGVSPKELVKTILTATPKSQLESCLYLYVNDRTINTEEADELARLFGLVK